MDIQHINVKIFAQEPLGVRWEEFTPVFHRWIQQRALPELLIDVADYAHVPEGPGMMIIAHEAFYSVDNRQSRPGLLYNRRMFLEGSTQDKLEHAYESALRAARMLESEPEFQGRIRFDERECEISVNDRMLAPNTETTWNALKPEIEEFFRNRFGTTPQLDWNSSPRELFRVRVQAGVPAAAAK
jgi:hypothetical protein